MNQPFIAVCMILRNAAETLDALLASIEGAFNEVVIVDTGSTDSTRDKVLAWAKAHGVVWTPGDVKAEVGTFADGTRLVLSTFDWVDDFARARNYAFGLASAKWRGYLDADDTFPRAQRLAPTIRRTEEVSPQTNCIALPYDYAGGELMQDKFRFVRWQDGWTWQDEIHEYLVRNPPGPRMISRYDDLVVVHNHSDEHTEASLKRNIRICTAVRDRALTAGDERKAALMSFYLGEYAAALGDPDAIDALVAAQAGLGDNNIACSARVRLARIFLDKADHDGALEWASLAAGRAPEQPEAVAALALALAASGQPDRAALTFDRLAALPRPAVRSAHDAAFVDGVANAVAAETYLAVGRLDAAVAALNRIPAALVQSPQVIQHRMRAHAAVVRADAMAALHRLWQVLVQNDEPMKARTVLRAAPAFVADLPAVAELSRLTNHRLRHIDGGWSVYKALYGDLDKGTYDPKRHDVEAIRAFARAKETRAWAANLPKDGPPIRLLAIGPQDGNIERDVLTACERIHLTCADASPLAEGAIADLVASFPGRVTHHPMADFYDWPEGPFDAIFFFEVLEHVPSDVGALGELERRLAPDGTLFLSTPVAGLWTNQTLDKPAGQTLYDWWGHVRSNSPSSLWQKIRSVGLDGRLFTTDLGGIFLGKLHSAHPPMQPSRRVSIFVPSTPHPFDPDSPARGHLGGSEEAVIYLADALHGLGYEVTVYSPPATRPDGYRVVAHEGVLWRFPEEFDAKGPHGAVLFWRCPQVLLDANVKAATAYRKILWLHDTHYDAPAAAYAAADEVVVLSHFHAEAITEGDGFTGPFTFAANGIDLSLFPRLTEEDEARRDPYAVVYGSSPDRGLDRLLDAWPMVHAREPRAHLDVFYSWDLLDKMMERNSDLRQRFGNLRQRVKDLAPLGVRFHGGVDHVTLARAYRQAAVWAYPVAGRFNEISCITAMKVQAAGCWPVVAASGALWETLREGLPLAAAHPDLDSEDGAAWFADRIVDALHIAPSDADRRDLSEWARERFGWARAAALFDAVICGGPHTR